MSPTLKVISLSQFNDIKSELKKSCHCPGELNVWTGEHDDHGYIVLIESNHHGCLMIDGPSIIAVNDGMSVGSRL